MILCIIFEVVLFAILIGGSYIGYKRGFIKLALKPCKNISCLGLSFVFCKIIADIIVEPIMNRLLVDRLFGQDDYIQTVYYVDQLANKVISSVSSKIIEAISILLSFIILFIVSKLLFSSLIGLINSIFDRGIIGRINQVAGFLCSSVISLLIAYIFVIGSQRVIALEELQNSEITKGFSGGVLYRIFLRLNS